MNILNIYGSNLFLINNNNNYNYGLEIINEIYKNNNLKKNVNIKIITGENIDSIMRYHENILKLYKSFINNDIIDDNYIKNIYDIDKNNNFIMRKIYDYNIFYKDLYEKINIKYFDYKYGSNTYNDIDYITYINNNNKFDNKKNIDDYFYNIKNYINNIYILIKNNSIFIKNYLSIENNSNTLIKNLLIFINNFINFCKKCDDYQKYDIIFNIINLLHIIIKSYENKLNNNYKSLYIYINDILNKINKINEIK